VDIQVTKKVQNRLNGAQSALSYRIHPSMTKHGQHFVPQSRKMVTDYSVIS